jgi:enoyl-CoA hydratase/carnithine racemase
MAKQLMFTSRRISGKTAGEIGLVDRVCAEGEDEVDAEVEALAREIAENSWDTNRIVKQLMREHRDVPRSHALAYERQAPFGMPRDMRDRMSGRSDRKKRTRSG